MTAIPNPYQASQRDHRELQFCRLLDELYGEDVTQGDTTQAVRCARARLLIQRMGGAERLVAKGQTMREAFARVFGEPLVPDAQTALFSAEHESNDGQ